MIRILLYSAEPMSSLGLGCILSGKWCQSSLLVGTSDDLNHLTGLIEEKKPDILLLEMTPEVTFDFMRDLRKRFESCKILLWVHSVSSELAFQMMGIGVRGIVRKTLSADELIDCFQKVGDGALWFDAKLLESMLGARKVNLTRREGQLVTLLSQGLKNKEIATVLGISENTIKVYMSRLFSKVGVKDRFELALLGLQNVASGESRLDRTAKNAHTGTQVVHGLRSLMISDGGRR